jgi:hypothetical protein
MYILFVLCVILVDNLFAFAFLVSSQQACFSLSLSLLSAFYTHCNASRIGPLLSSMYFGHDNVWKCKQ